MPAVLDIYRRNSIPGAGTPDASANFPIEAHIPLRLGFHYGRAKLEGGI
jgi:hypothetical protein